MVMHIDVLHVCVVLMIVGECNCCLVVREEGSGGLEGAEELGKETVQPECLLHAVHCVMVQLAHMSENYGDMHGNPMMGSGRLPEGRLEGVGPRMEAGEPLEGRSTGNNEVSMSHGHSRQDSDYLACQPILAWSM